MQSVTRTRQYPVPPIPQESPTTVVKDRVLFGVAGVAGVAA